MKKIAFLLSLFFVCCLISCGKKDNPSASTVTTTTTPTYTVSTIAGGGSSMTADGVGIAAGFTTILQDITVDASGNLYLIDNNRIRKITSAGMVTTLAGGLNTGFADGPGTAAAFNAPTCLVFDAAGNLYVTDTNNNRIRKITPSGVVSTFAGNGTAGFTDGPGANASFSAPAGIALDAAGNIYVLDLGNLVIRKITPAGIVSTFAGNGTAISLGTFAYNYGHSLIFDRSGNLYVDDTNHIVKIAPSGAVSTLVTSVAVGSALNFMTIDADANMYVTGSQNNKVLKVSPLGIVSTVAGTGRLGADDGLGTAATFNLPWGITIDASGNIYVVDRFNAKIRKISKQ